MFAFMRRVRATRDAGASAVEYGLLVAAIAAVIAAAVFALGGYINGAFTSTCKTVAANGVTSTSTNGC